MATILAYTSPALGHVLPISALLSELSRRGHNIHLRTYSAGIEIGQRLGFEADAIDLRIEALEHDDWKASSTPAALKRAFAMFCRRAQLEVADFSDVVARVRPDAVLVDVMCWAHCLPPRRAVSRGRVSPHSRRFYVQKECLHTARACGHCRTCSDAFVTPSSGP